MLCSHFFNFPAHSWSNELAVLLGWFKHKQLQSSKLIREQNIIGLAEFGSYP